MALAICSYKPTLNDRSLAETNHWERKMRHQLGVSQDHMSRRKAHTFPCILSIIAFRQYVLQKEGSLYYIFSLKL